MSSTSEFVRAVDFVGVPTRDIGAAAAFYGETLGLPRSVYMSYRRPPIPFSFTAVHTRTWPMNLSWPWCRTAIPFPMAVNRPTGPASVCAPTNRL